MSSVAKFAFAFSEDMAKFSHVYATENCPDQLEAFHGTVAVAWGTKKKFENFNVLRDWQERCVKMECPKTPEWPWAEGDVHHSGVVFCNLMDSENGKAPKFMLCFPLCPNE